MQLVPSLTVFINDLNIKALKLDLRSDGFVLPKGFVVTVKCDKGVIRLGVANGFGGIDDYKFPEETKRYQCLVKEVKKKSSFLSYFNKLIFCKKKKEVQTA